MSIPQVNTLSRKESRRLILVLTMMLKGASAYERKVAMQYHKDTIKIREAASRARAKARDKEVHP